MKPSGKAPAKKSSPRTQRDDAAPAARPKARLPADPLSTANLESMGLRLGLPSLAAQHQRTGPAQGK